jgi:methyl-accepting chemotaxis protein
MSDDAARLLQISDELADGAREGVARNQTLSALAAENRARFDAGAAALEALAGDTHANLEAVAALASASEDFGAFVTLVQRMARQSKLLALNAAMEAARAGEHGQGFAVVASEVRRLATTSAEAAETTSALMREVLEKVTASRASSARTRETVAEVLETTRLGRESFLQVEHAVRGTEAWTAAIEQAASGSRSLVGELTARLEELTRATESYAAAMQEVAASSEEQSASTEEIASAASSVADSAARLSALVATFRLEESGGDASAIPPAAPAPPVAPDGTDPTALAPPARLATA